MWKSSTPASRYGSALNWDLPIQFWLVAPRSDGWRVMLGLVATGTPLSHMVPVVPDSVIATCCQPVGSCGPDPLAGIICDPAPALISNRRAFVPPALAVRNMKSDVPVP